MSKFEHHRHPERRKRLSQIASWIIVGALVPALAVSAISAATCEQTPGLPNASPKLSLHCELPGERTVDIAIGGLEAHTGKENPCV